MFMKDGICISDKVVCVRTLVTELFMKYTSVIGVFMKDFTSVVWLGFFPTRDGIYKCIRIAVHQLLMGESFQDYS